MPSASKRRKTGRDRVAWLYLAPALLAYAIFVGYPYLTNIWYSLFEWAGVGAAKWVGLQNYFNVFTDAELLGTIIHALGFILYFSVMPIALGLVLAAIVARRKTSWGLVRTLVFLPQIMPLVAVGVVWQWIYSQNGPLNQFLSSVGLGSWGRAWLGDFDFAYSAVGLVGTWVNVGLCMILLLAGIQKIDTSIYEAIRLDGGGAFREFFAVTLPGIRGEIAFAATITVVSALASFDVIYVMTRGGPGTTTLVPGVSIYNLAFNEREVGQAAALAFVLSVMVYLVVLVIGRVGRGKRETV